MKRFAIMALSTALAAASALAGQNTRAFIKTSEGEIEIELWPDKAPATVSNFLRYSEEKFYDGLIFHRVIPRFMIQGGGFTADMSKKPPKAPIKNEASASAPNRRGTIAMARTMMVDSATSQFFINLVDNSSLDHKNETPQGFGYCVFGEVVSGMDVVDKIAGVKTGRHGPFRDVPVDPITIVSVSKQDATPSAEPVDVEKTTAPEM